MLGNALSFQHTPAGVVVMEPSFEAHVVFQVIGGNFLAKARSGAEGAPSSVMVPYHANDHWHTLVFDFKAKHNYYFEAFGTELRGKKPI